MNGKNNTNTSNINNNINNNTINNSNKEEQEIIVVRIVIIRVLIRNNSSDAMGLGEGAHLYVAMFSESALQQFAKLSYRKTGFKQLPWLCLS